MTEPYQPPLSEWSEDHSPGGRCDFCERMGIIIDHDGEDPIDAIRRLSAEVDRLRADLADAHDRIDNALLALHAWGPYEDADEDVQAVYAALSAGGGGPTEGDGGE